MRDGHGHRTCGMDGVTAIGMGDRRTSRMSHVRGRSRYRVRGWDEFLSGLIDMRAGFSLAIIDHRVQSFSVHYRSILTSQLTRTRCPDSAWLHCAAALTHGLTVTPPQPHESPHVTSSRPFHPRSKAVRARPSRPHSLSSLPIPHRDATRQRPCSCLYQAKVQTEMYNRGDTPPLGGMFQRPRCLRSSCRAPRQIHSSVVRAHESDATVGDRRLRDIAAGGFRRAASG